MNNKFWLQGGPSFNFLVKSDYENAVIQYSIDQSGDENIEKVYFDTSGELSKILYGINLRASYKIINRVDLFAASQYYFNSVFDVKDSVYRTGEECRPLLIQTGLSFAIIKM
jgi:hypothetical protein